ncbi:MAG TPA: surface-adhesin E family protein [Usitatibacter sp.]|nr:surface-adhesin E family protein [Usitatibacter sp.]
MNTRKLAWSVALVAALPASAQVQSPEMQAAIARWELLRANQEQRLSIDPKSLHTRGADTRFTYLVDFREMQGEIGGKYRSLVVGARLHCKERQMAVESYELYTGATGTGILLAQPQPSAAEKRLQPLQKGSSDEELYQRVCQGPAAGKK